MEVDREPRRRGIEPRYRLEDRAEKGKDREADDAARDQVAERHAPGLHVGAGLRHVGCQCAADVGADHQGESELGFDQAARCKRHDQ